MLQIAEGSRRDQGGLGDNSKRESNNSKSAVGFEHLSIMTKKTFNIIQNSKNIFGRTAYYAPDSETVVIYVTNRHPKDICRSFAHELVHHHQNERGDLQKGDASSPKYAQEDDHMRKMEMEAYLKGNLLFRDWEDWYKNYRKTNQR